MRSIGLISLGGVVLAAPLFLACTLGYADLVRRDQYGGTLALKGHQGAAMEDAQEMMAAHCQGAYQIVREEQVVVGEQTQADYGESYNRRTTSGSASSTTTNITEYHVTYQCGGAQPAAAANPAGSMQPAGTMQPAPQEGTVQPQY